MSTVILDTNGYTAYLGGDHDVLDFLADADIIYMSIFVLGSCTRDSREETGKRKTWPYCVVSWTNPASPF